MKLEYNDLISQVRHKLVNTESGGNPKALGPDTKGDKKSLRDNAMGLWQIMPDTWDWIAKQVPEIDPKKPFDGPNNEKAGRWYMNYLLKRFKGNLPLAVAAYHTGEGTIGELADQFGHNIKSIYPRLGPNGQQYVVKIFGKGVLA